MGYSHYWYRKPVLNPNKFEAAINDCRKLVAPLAQAGIDLAGWEGKGAPTFSATGLALNGVGHCGHAQEDLGITWPSKQAGGVDTSYEGSRKASDGTWFAGKQLSTRVCGGDCSHESFRIDQVEQIQDFMKAEGKQRVFGSCKTAYKPYDLAVTAFLIVFKHHFGNAFFVSSDGEMKDWFDAQLLCNTILGYGLDFTLDEDDD